MTIFLEQTLNGLTLGGIYALIALGYTMVYGVLRMINFAHSEIFMLGAVFGWIFLGFFPGVEGFWVTAAVFLVAVVVTGAAGSGMFSTIRSRRDHSMSPRRLASVSASFGSPSVITITLGPIHGTSAY